VIINCLIKSDKVLIVYLNLERSFLINSPGGTFTKIAYNLNNINNMYCNMVKCALYRNDGFIRI